MRAGSIALVILVISLAGCGGGGGSKTMSPTEYRSRLATISREADAAQHRVEAGLHAKSVARLRKLLTAFAAASDRLGAEVATLKPPKNAAAANAQLARGERETASATRAAVARLAHVHSTQKAMQMLSSRLANAKGAHDLDQALMRLRQLGYTKGS